MIAHPAVASSTLTCSACPEQYEGRLTDGRWFYFRYRHGWAGLAVGDDYAAVMGREDEGMQVGDGLDGCFGSTDLRNEVFTELMSRLPGALVLDTTQIRRDLDAAIAAAIPVAGGRIRPLLHRLRNELAHLDRQRADTAARQDEWQRRQGWPLDQHRTDSATNPGGTDAHL